MENLNKIPFIFFLVIGSLTSYVSNAQTTLIISGSNDVCVGDVSTYTLSPSVAGATFTWTVSSQGNVLNSGSSAVIQWITTGSATISVQGVDTAGTPIAQGSLNVTINDIPKPNIVPSTFVTCAVADTIRINETPCIQACENSTVIYSVANIAGATYNWTVNGETSFTTSGNTCTVLWGIVGIGTVTVEVVHGACIGTDLFCVEIIESPEALFETFPEPDQQTIDICLNTSILFFDLSSAPDDSPIVSWVWDFDDGTVMSNGVGSAGNPVEHSYSQTGLYRVTLVVTNACGCTDSFSIFVNVSEYQGIQIECPGVVCKNDQVEYTVDNPSCTQSSWDAEGGQIIAQNSQSATVVWDAVDELGFGYITYSNECQPCAGQTRVKIPVITDNATIQGPVSVCPNTIYNYSLPQWPGTRFAWSLSGDATFLASDQPNVLSVLTGNSGSFLVRSDPACNTLLNCVTFDSLTVNISPQVNIIGASESCITLSSEYTLSNDSSIATWTLTSPSGITTQYNNQGSIEPTFTEVGTYTLEITGNFCSNELFQITVHPKPPAPIISGPDSACVGVPTQYSALPQLPGVTTQWGAFYGTSNPAAGANTSITFTNLNLPFDLYASNAIANITGCQTLSLIEDILPLAPSSITLTTDAPPSLEVCGSSQWQFDVDYTGGDLYQWEILDPAMGSIVAGNNSPSVEVLFNNPLGSSEDVDVIVAVTKCNQILRDTLTMHVVNAPDYTVTPGDTTICANEELDFTISPTPTGYTSLLWEFGDGLTSTQVNPSHAFPNNTGLAVFNPTVTIVNPEGCVSTSVIQAGPVTVKPAPVALLSPATNFIGCGSFSQLLSDTVSTGFGSTTNYEWFGPPAPPTPPNCASCDTWNVTQYGDYKVVVENSNGCQGVSNTVSIIENCGSSNCPSVPVVASDSSFISCARVQATIQYNPAGLNISGESWFFPDGAVNTSSTTGTTGTATASFDEAGVYLMTYSIAHDNCTTNLNQFVYVPFVGDMRYSVSCGTGSLYDITLYDHSNVFPSEEGSIQHSYAYRTVPGGTWQTITAPSSALTVDAQLPAGNYELREIIFSSLTIAAPACTTIVNVNLPDKPDADFEIVSPFEPACINDVVVHFNNLSTPGSGLIYLWDFGEENTNYQSDPDKVYASSGIQLITLTATNGIGCKDSTQNTIEIQDNDLWDGSTKPGLLTNPSPPVCIGTPISLGYFNLGFPSPPNFTWYQGSTPITPVVTASSFDVTQGGDYWVMGSDEFGCLVPSAPASVYFTPIQTPTIIGNPAQCDSVPFTLTSSILAPGLVFEWERSPGGVVGAGSTLSQTLPVGVYTYTLSATQNGCEGVSAPYTVTVANAVDTPAVSFNITSCQPYVVELTATNAQSGTYNWTNGSTGSTVNGFTGGLFEVYFTSTTGCTSSNEITLPKSPQEYIWTFPTGCFCLDELGPYNNSACATLSTIPGPYTLSFAYWSYQVNGIDVLTGTDTQPSPFSSIAPDSINLILDNGFCQITSDAMYISENCSEQSQQGITNSGGSTSGVDNPILPPIKRGLNTVLIAAKAGKRLKYMILPEGGLKHFDPKMNLEVLYCSSVTL